MRKMTTNKEYDRTKHRSIITRDRTEKELHVLLSFGRDSAISMEKELFNPAVFSEIRFGENEGIGIYYPVYRDGSCAEAQYIKFSYRKFRNGDVVILERASKDEMEEYDKERLGHLLRR
jgi:hypothetical protein